MRQGKARSSKPGRPTSSGLLREMGGPFGRHAALTHDKVETSTSLRYQTRLAPEAFNPLHRETDRCCMGHRPLPRLSVVLAPGGVGKRRGREFRLCTFGGAIVTGAAIPASQVGSDGACIGDSAAGFM